MAGKYITDQQVKLYMKYRKDRDITQELCAAKAGFSTRSAYAIEWGKHYTQQPKKSRDYKTRASPIDEVWANDLVYKLKENPLLQPKTLLIYLQRTYVDEIGTPLYDESVLRTLQRRVAHWLAQHGPSKAIIFPQIHLPGQQSLSDFTHMNRSNILIKGVVFKHMLYHFRLVYSKWSYVKVIQSGESFQALSEGLQEALMQIGGAPKEHRTDSLSAAFKNLTKEAKNDLTNQYYELCHYYGMEPTRNNKGVCHENGSVESSHGHLKNRIEQELLLRGSNDFDSINSYEHWVQEIVSNSNKRNSKNFIIEKNSLQPLPINKTIDYELLSIRVSYLSLMVIRNITYSVPSRLAGHVLTIHLYQHKMMAYLGSSKVLEIERKYKNKQSSRYVIDYRHIIHSLIKKPQAFRFCKYRDEILPTLTYQSIWQYLDATESKQVAPKILLRLLKLATDYHCEYELGQHVLSLIQTNSPLDIEIIERDFNGSNPFLPSIDCKQHHLSNYDNYIPHLSNTDGDQTNATI